MSEFHYVRTRGTDGGVDACEGPAIGLDLETVLKDGLPPWNIALELVAALCEILDIADEDGEVHGEVHPKYVFIDETGAVSLEGFGVKRRKTRAPEGVPKDTRTDLYGLGYTAYRCFCSHPLPETVPADPTAHDEMIVDAALEIDLSGVPNEMQGDVQWYVAKLMEFQPSERPTALEAWRTFVAFANGSPGVDMSEWCAAALDGGGVRRAETPRDSSGAPAPEPAPREEEDLGGPVMVKGPLTGRLPFDDSAAAAAAASAKAGATAFWTRAEMKRALERADDDPEDRTLREGSPPPSGPSITGGTVARGGGRSQGPGGGAAATAFWSQSELDAMARGDQNAPRPRRVEGEGERRRAVTASQVLSAGDLELPAGEPGRIQRGVGPRTAPPPSGPPPTLAGPGISEDPTVRADGHRPAPSKAPVTRFEPGPGPGAVKGPPTPPPGTRTVRPEVAPRVSNAAPNLDPATRSGPREPVTPTRKPVVVPPPPAPPPAEGEEGGGLKFVLFGGGIAAAGLVGAGLLVLGLVILVAVVSWPRGDTVAPPEIASPTPVVTPPPDVVPASAGTAPTDGGTADVVPETDAPEADAPETAPAPDPKPKPKPDPKPQPAPKPTVAAPTPTPKPAAPAPAPEIAPKPSPAPKPEAPAPKPKPGAKPKPEPQPAAAQPAPKPTAKPQPTSEGAARVTIRSLAGGTVNGCSGSKVDFVGTRAFTIDAYLLPATCLVTIDGARGVFQVYGSGEVNCEKQGSVVVCDKQQVP